VGRSLSSDIKCLVITGLQPLTNVTFPGPFLAPPGNANLPVGGFCHLYVVAFVCGDCNDALQGVSFSCRQPDPPVLTSALWVGSVPRLEGSFLWTLCASAQARFVGRSFSSDITRLTINRRQPLRKSDFLTARHFLRFFPIHCRDNARLAPRVRIYCGASMTSYSPWAVTEAKDC